MRGAAVFTAVFVLAWVAAGVTCVFLWAAVAVPCRPPAGTVVVECERPSNSTPPPSARIAITPMRATIRISGVMVRFMAWLSDQ